MKKIVFFTIALQILLTGCLYKMPNDTYSSTLPTPNAPHLTGETSAPFIPGRG